jgi:hypothetical protein
MIETITRSEFKAAIETGLKRSGLDAVPAAAAALRAVGDTATQVAHGTFWLGESWSDALTPDEYECGCPLTEARITNKTGALTDLGIRLGVSTYHVSPFASGFDGALVRYDGERVTVSDHLKIIED